MRGKTQEMLLTLSRTTPAEHWGFSLVGGADVNTPLIVTRVAFGYPVDGTLHRGDIITKIGSYDSRDIRHQDAQNLFKNAGNNIRVVVHRQVLSRNPGLSKLLAKIAENNRDPSDPAYNQQQHHHQNASTGSSRASSRNYSSPLSVSPHLSPRGYAGGYYPSPGASSMGSSLTPVYSSSFTPLDDYHFTVEEINDFRSLPRSGDTTKCDEQIGNQPYRTTPLVLCGAKVKHEPTVTESYLRHHPNPAVRARPHQLDTDYLLRQKVANTVLHKLDGGDQGRPYVHKQFNSPIGLYSDANVADSIHRQTGAPGGGGAPRRPVKFNPAESETYRAIQEQNYDHYPSQTTEHSALTRVYATKPVPNTKKPVYQHQVYNDDENIQQSGSFKRIMWSVMGDY